MCSNIFTVCKAWKNFSDDTSFVRRASTEVPLWQSADLSVFGLLALSIPRLSIKVVPRLDWLIFTDPATFGLLRLEGFFGEFRTERLEKSVLSLLVDLEKDGSRDWKEHRRGTPPSRRCYRCPMRALRRT